MSRRLRCELIVYQSSRRPSVHGPSVRASVRVFTLSKMNISETNGSIATKFYLNHHWDGGEVDRILFTLAGNNSYIHESLDEFEIRPDITTGFLGNR